MKVLTWALAVFVTVFFATGAFAQVKPVGPITPTPKPVVIGPAVVPDIAKASDSELTVYGSQLADQQAKLTKRASQWKDRADRFQKMSDSVASRLAGITEKIKAVDAEMTQRQNVNVQHSVPQTD